MQGRVQPHKGGLEIVSGNRKAKEPVDTATMEAIKDKALEFLLDDQPASFRTTDRRGHQVVRTGGES
jgi:hypothetical protein